MSAAGHSNASHHRLYGANAVTSSAPAANATPRGTQRSRPACAPASGSATLIGGSLGITGHCIRDGQCDPQGLDAPPVGAHDAELKALQLHHFTPPRQAPEVLGYQARHGIVGIVRQLRLEV